MHGNRTATLHRRAFMLALAACGAPIATARAAERIRTVGMLLSLPLNDLQWTRLPALQRSLAKLGWIEGRTLRYELRSSHGGPAVREAAARELVALRPDVIIANSTPDTAALLAVTRTIPIIFATAADPVGSGFVASLARPGGNTTGFINLEASIAGKWLELLREIAPGIERAGLLFNPATAPYAEYYLGPFKAAGRSLGVAGVAVPVTDAPSLESAMAQSQESKTGLVVLPDSFTTGHRSDIIALAARHHVPAIYPYRFFPEIGGLLSYGNDQLDNFRRAAAYADRVLKGEKVGELPVQVPAKFELVINLKTAKALGLTVPASLLAVADEVIE